MTNFISIKYLCILLTFCAINVSPNTKPSFDVQFDQNEILIKRYTTEDGMPQNTPNAILQTRDGYIWIATYGGLARFDGVKFTIFTTNNFPGLSNNRLISLAEDDSGSLWILSEDGDLISYSEGRFSLKISAKDSKEFGHLNCIYVDKNDLVWLGSSRGLITFNKITAEITTHSSLDLSAGNSLIAADLGVKVIASDSKGTLYFGTNAGLATLQDNKFLFYPTSVIHGDLLLVNGDENIPHTRVYFLSGNDVLMYSNGRISKADILISALTIPSPDQVEKNKLLVAGKSLYRSTNSGLERFDLPEQTFEDRLLSRSGSTLFDREGNIWLGSHTTLQKIRKKRLKVFSVLEGNTKHPTTAMIETADKTIWVSTDSTILKLVTDPQGRITTSSIDLEKGPIVSIATDKAGDL